MAHIVTTENELLLPTSKPVQASATSGPINTREADNPLDFFILYKE